MIDVLIADNHILVREGFKKIIGEEIDLRVVGECKDAEEVLEFLRNDRCDVLVLDIDMPGKSGLDLLLELRQMDVPVRVLVQSIHPEERFATRAFKLGAAGYITKEAAAEELVKAIRKVYHGGVYVSESLAEKMAFELRNDIERPPHEKLSPREFQIFRLIASGQSMQEIKRALCLSLSTVNTHRRHILEKMGLKSNADIVRYAIRNKLVD